MKKNIGVSTPVKPRFAEQCWILTGIQDGAGTWRFRRHCKSSGGAASVEAAWDWALRREERLGDVVGFFHTHPHGVGAHPSFTDIRTMRAWCSAFGKTLLCVIATKTELNGYLFFHPEGSPKPVDCVFKAEQGWYTVQAKVAKRRQNE